MRGCTCRGLALCDQCQRLAERAGVLAPPQVPAVTETQFQAAIRRLATQHGWLVYAVHDSRKSPPGYPDLTLARMPEGERPGQVLFAELKVPGGSLTAQQEVWLATLSHVHEVETHLWRPEDWEAIRRRLTC